MNPIRITELQGDGIGPELTTAVRSVASRLPLDFEFLPVDWSLEAREQMGDRAIDSAEASLRKTRLGLKYPTVTQRQSPNALIRRRLGFSVIYRPVTSIPGISSNFIKPIDLHIVRVATGGTYDDPGQLVGNDAAVSLRMVEREPCSQAAQFALALAKKMGKTLTSASKHTIQRATDGLFESVVRDLVANSPEVEHRVELFDALLAKIILKPEEYGVIVVLNEYGDFLSDMASGLAGSIGVGASGSFSFTRERKIDIALFDPAGGTAPDIAGKNCCNPTAMLLAFSMLLDHVGESGSGTRLRNALYGAIAEGASTVDLGGSLTTTGFTKEVVDRLAYPQEA